MPIRLSAFVPLLAATLLVASASGAQAAPSVPSLVVSRGIAFSQPDDATLRLDVWRLAGVRDRPVLVLLHGGGWRVGDRREWDARGWTRWYAARGYVVVNANYRLACQPRARAGPMAPESPALCGSTMAHALEDVREVLAWVRRNAQRHGGRPGSVVLMGGSAGAQLALRAASDAPAGVRAVVALSPPADLAWFGQRPGSRLNWAVTNAVGCSWQQCAQRWRSLSPAHSARMGRLPPRTYLASARSDEVTPWPQVSRYASVLRRTGVTVTLRSPADARVACHGPWACERFRLSGSPYRLRQDIHRWIRGR